MREKYHKQGSPSELPSEFKAALGLTEPSQWTVTNLQAVQPRVAEPLVLYWYVGGGSGGGGGDDDDDVPDEEDEEGMTTTLRTTMATVTMISILSSSSSLSWLPQSSLTAS